jgi:hypothetical protein
MAKLAQAYDTQFQIALGDNFYFTGVKSPMDKRFKVSSSQLVQFYRTRL